MVDAYSSFSGVSLEGHSLGLAATQLEEPQRGVRYFALDVAEGVEELRFEMSGGTGDADLYVRRGAVPTTSSWDYRPYRWGNDESVTIASPAWIPSTISTLSSSLKPRTTSRFSTRLSAVMTKARFSSRSRKMAFLGITTALGRVSVAM